MKGRLSPRSDNGQINSSPVTATTPIVRVQWGCTRVINIPGIYNIDLAVGMSDYTSYSRKFVFIPLVPFYIGDHASEVLFFTKEENFTKDFSN